MDMDDAILEDQMLEDQNLDTDDLQFLGTHCTPKSTTGINHSDDRSSAINMAKVKAKNMNMNVTECGLVIENIDTKREKSDVWKNFTRVGIIDGVEKCQCKHCDKFYTCKASSGTTHLRRHVGSCLKVPKFNDMGASSGSQANLFDSKAYRDALSRCIIQHDLPFTYAEYEGVARVNKILNPGFKSITRNTAKNDCLKVFRLEKEKLKNLLANISGRICLTSDVWTAVTTQGYMTVTAHYVDKQWKLNSKLLSFCELDPPHTGFELSSKLLGVLKDWGIESKIFSLTLDNATNNDNMIRILKDRINLHDGLLCKGEFFHVRCSAHILNLIVQEGLKAAEDALKKIRISVKYVKSSEGRLREFQKCVQEVNLSDVGGSFLRLDVSTRWNSTYLMLESAIKYRRAFTSLSYNDRNYKYCPSDEEWERADRVRIFLAPFDEITNLISGSTYSTSNLYFRQIALIELKLNGLMKSQDEVIQDMASRMKVKFDKYWDEYCSILVFGSILDPHAKLRFLNFCYKRLYPQDYQERVNKVKRALYKLFSEYERVGTSSLPTDSSREGLDKSSSPSRADELDEYQEELMTSNLGISELDVYLEEVCKVEKTNDVIEYWNTNKSRFPRLARMACDILSIPITTVASESTFSITGRILNKYRNCLLPKTVQALICTRNWLHGYTEEVEVIQEVEEIYLSKEDSNVLDDIVDEDDINE